MNITVSQEIKSVDFIPAFTYCLILVKTQEDKDKLIEETGINPYYIKINREFNSIAEIETISVWTYEFIDLSQTEIDYFAYYDKT